MLSYESPVPANGQPSLPAEILQQHPQTTIAASQLTAMAASTLANANASVHGTSGQPVRHIYLVTGPAGCGKSTVAKDISEALGIPYVEGDEYHSESNVEKMRTGTPLTDADRWDWLTVLRDESVKRLHQGAQGVVLTCSALKRKYRDVIRVASYFDPTVAVHFIFLDASEEVLLRRVAARQNHYMGANMVRSQFSILERPAADETDVFPVDVSVTPEEVKKNALAKVWEIQNAAQQA